MKFNIIIIYYYFLANASLDSRTYLFQKVQFLGQLASALLETFLF